MVDSASSTKTINLKGLVQAVQTSKSNGKYSLIFDKTHNAEVFFRYKAHLVEVNKLSIGLTIGKVTKEEAIEPIRKGLVHCMRSGDTLVLYLGNISPDFKTVFTSDETNFPAETVFNVKEWLKEEVYKKIVREDEDRDLMGNKNMFWMH